MFTWARVVRGAVLSSLAMAAVPLAVWAAGPSRWAVSVGWADDGRVIAERIVRTGFDRHGVVRQSRTRLWQAATSADLADVRQAHAIGAVDLPPPRSQWLQFTTYGNDHVYAGGRSLTESGAVASVPYGLMAVALATPAAAWAAWWWTRRRT